MSPAVSSHKPPAVSPGGDEGRCTECCVCYQLAGIPRRPQAG
jgi:hypothetical protein